MKNRSIETYKKTVKTTFSFLKQTARFDDLLARSIVLPNGEGFLVPLCEMSPTDTALIAKLARWRADNTFAYPTQFQVTIHGTATWLRYQLLDVEDRILFLVLDKHGEAIGHLGYAHALNDEQAMEIDNVVRGVRDVHPGLMSSAMIAILKWAEDTIRPHSIYLDVLSHNQHAIDFYHKLGFVDDKLQPLRQHIQGNITSYRPVAEDDNAVPNAHFLKMVYKPPKITKESGIILTAGPSISASEASYALDAARNGWNQQWNAYLKKFEHAFSEYLGVKHVITTSSCTGALHIALAALGIGPGDEVIVPDITWVATANAVVYVGGTPVFADIEPDSWCLNPVSFEAAITHRTKAVMPVHLYGHPTRMDKIMEIARKHKLFVVEDAAPAVGAEFGGQKVGTFGDFAAFSFQGAKLLVTGEGGILVTNNDELYAKAHKIADQGRDDATFWISGQGLKYKMSNIQAAIGLGQLERVDGFIEAKREIFGWYKEMLQGVPNIQVVEECPWARSIYWMSSIMIGDNLVRDELREELIKRGIDTRPTFPPISQYPIWATKADVNNPIARHVGEKGLNLPSGVRLQLRQIKYICDSIKEIVS